MNSLSEMLQYAREIQNANIGSQIGSNFSAGFVKGIEDKKLREQKKFEDIKNIMEVQDRINATQTLDQFTGNKTDFSALAGLKNSEGKNIFDVTPKISTVPPELTPSGMTIEPSGRKITYTNKNMDIDTQFKQSQIDKNKAETSKINATTETKTNDAEFKKAQALFKNAQNIYKNYDNLLSKSNITDTKVLEQIEQEKSNVQAMMSDFVANGNTDAFANLVPMSLQKETSKNMFGMPKEKIVFKAKTNVTPISKDSSQNSINSDPIVKFGVDENGRKVGKTKSGKIVYAE